MFTVKKETTTERYCPHGHEPLSELRTDDHKVKFCHVCGASIEERQSPYHAAYCSDCNSPVNPLWNYCPYCGQGRDS